MYNIIYSSGKAMASIAIQLVKDVHALRDSARDTRIPPFILKAIERVQDCISREAVQPSSRRSDQSASHSQSHSQTFKDQKPYSNRFTAAFNKPEQKSNPSTTSEVRRDVGRPDVGRTYGSKGRNEDISRAPAPKYVSKFKKSSDNIDDTILNTILRGKLNKFSQSNYNEIKEFITHIIDGGQTDMIKCFMKLVFEKAVCEEIFCPLYAKLVSELTVAYPILFEEMTNLYTEYILIFDEVSEKESEDYNEMCKRNIEKKYRRGYSQFLAELIKHNVVHVNFLVQIIDKIIIKVEEHSEQPDSTKLIEEYADCLMKIVKAIQQQHVTNTDIQALRAYLKTDENAQIQLLTVRTPTQIGISNKSRFTFLDIYEGIEKL